MEESSTPVPLYGCRMKLWSSAVLVTPVVRLQVSWPTDQPGTRVPFNQSSPSTGVRRLQQALKPTGRLSGRGVIPGSNPEFWVLAKRTRYHQNPPLGRCSSHIPVGHLPVCSRALRLSPCHELPFQELPSRPPPCDLLRLQTISSSQWNFPLGSITHIQSA